MTSNLGGIDPHRDNFTVGIIDPAGIAVAHEAFDNDAAGYLAAIDMLTDHGVDQVGIEGSAKLGAHVAIAVVAAGFDCREVPPSRSAAQRRSRRLEKTDAVDAIATARALWAEPTLGPVQTLEVYDPVVAEIEAVLEHRRSLVSRRTLTLHHVADQLQKLPTEVRDQLPIKGDTVQRLRALAAIDTTQISTRAGAHRVAWLIDHIEVDRAEAAAILRLEKRLHELLDEHGTTLREEPGIGVISAATLVCEVGDPFRFASESKFSRWCGVGAVAISSAEGSTEPTKHRLDFAGNRRINSIFYIISVTQGRITPEAQHYLARKLSEGKTSREARRAHKRHLANRAIRRMWRDEQTRRETSSTTITKIAA